MRVPGVPVFTWIAVALLGLWVVWSPPGVDQAVEVVPESEGEPAVAAVYHALPDLDPVMEWRPGSGGTSAPAPMTLSTSDGQDLRLTSLRADVVLEDPIAFTELRLSFENPEDRQREGTFEIALPETAVLARVAMKVNGVWQEGEVVERSRARAVYEEYLHERPNVDPLLLEHESGRRFSAKVFPILPRERKEIVISYTETLDRSPYRLRLSGLGRMEALDVRVRVEGAELDAELDDAVRRGRVLEYSRKKHTPEGDLLVRLSSDDRVAAAAVARDMLIARIPVPAEVAADPVDGVTVLVDTSASAAGQSARVEWLAASLEALPDPASIAVQVLCFDQDVVEVYRGSAAGFRQEALPRIVARGAMGATDLARALEVTATSDPLSRVLVVSDGLPTAGPTTPAALAPAVSALAQAGVERLDALANGDDGNRLLLGAMVSTILPRAGLVIDQDTAAEEVAQLLGRASLADTRIEVEGALFRWPEDLSGLAPGDDLVVVAQVATPWPNAVRVSFSDRRLATQVVEPIPVERPLLQRAVVAGRIARLRSNLTDPELAPMIAAEYRRRVVALSTHYRVVTEETAFLVLESDAELQRYGLLREELPDIVTVADGHLKVIDRSTASKPDHGVLFDLLFLPPHHDPSLLARNRGILEAIAAQSGHFLASPYGGSFAVGNDDEDVWGGLTGTEVGEAFGVGGLGLVGTGRGGGGTGEGTVGLGNFGLIGKGGGSGTGSGYGRGSGAGFGGRGYRRKGGEHAPMFKQSIGALGMGVPIGLLRPRSLDRPQGEKSSESSTVVPTEAAPLEDPSAEVARARRRPQGLRSRALIGSRRPVVPTLRASMPEHDGPLDRDIVRRIVRAHVNQVRHCVNQVLDSRPLLGRIEIAVSIAGSGHVEAVRASEDDVGLTCVERVARRWRFPESSGTTHVRLRWDLSLHDTGIGKRHRRVEKRDDRRMARITQLLGKGQEEAALEAAWRWNADAPGDVFSLIVLGDTAKAAGDPKLAARAYGSVIDLWPSRSGLRRVAGERLATLESTEHVELARDSLAKAVDERPDELVGHRLTAIAALRAGDLPAAFEALERGLSSAEEISVSGTASTRGASWWWSRYRGARGLMAEDLRMVGTAWAARDESRRQEIEQRLAALSLELDARPSLRVVLHWENDATDVDLHLDRIDAKGKKSTLRPFFDVVDGYGPEYWLVRDVLPETLRVRAHYYDRGAMGPTAGVLHVITHDGRGNIDVVERPFVLMKAQALVDFGQIEVAA